MLVSDIFGGDPLDGFSDDARLKIQLVASLVLGAFDGGDWPLARQIWEEAELDNDERTACWTYFTDYSMQRAFLKGEDRKSLQDLYERFPR